MVNSDCGGHNSAAAPLAEALKLIDTKVEALSEYEVVPLRQALGRVCAAAICSRIDVPGHDNAAMDGYAFNYPAAEGGGVLSLINVGTVLAGDCYDGVVAAGECVRIMTGAPVPMGTDTVVMQELVSVDGASIHLNGSVARGDNVRRAGEDVAVGATVLPAGCVVQASHLGVLASVGITTLPVLLRPKVALLSTGDELCAAGEQLGPGQIYDSNRENLFGLLTGMGVEVLDLGRIGDDPQAIEKTLLDAATRVDMIVSSGGASVGEADYMSDLLERLGTLELASVAIKPGRPTLFGKLAGALFFGLPGNPVSVSVTFDQLVAPALRKLAGARGRGHRIELSARCDSALTTRRGRTEFQRGVLRYDPQQGYVVERAGRQGSGMLSSMTRANCFIVVPDDRGSVAAGSEVAVVPFDTLV